MCRSSSDLATSETRFKQLELSRIPKSRNVHTDALLVRYVEGPERGASNVIALCGRTTAWP